MYRDYVGMGLSEIVDAASRRAPLVIVASISAAVAGAWFNVSPWPSYALTVALLLLAVVVWRGRGPARLLKSKEQLGFRRNRDLLAFELFAKGMPRGYHALAFLSGLAFVLTGVRFPYAAVAIAGMLLTFAWGVSGRRYPSEMVD